MTLSTGFFICPQPPNTPAACCSSLPVGYSKKCARYPPHEADIFLRTHEEACYASLQGQIFEVYTHRKLAAGGDYRVRELLSSVEEQQSIPALPLQSDLSALDDLEPIHYGVPKARNFAVGDAMVLPQRLYQMTVSTSHPVKGAHLLEFVNAWENVDLYFVVPESIYGSFPRQRYVTAQGKAFQNPPKHLAKVTQYVLCMPLG